MTAITNNAHRPIIEAYELTQTERQEFAYLDRGPADSELLKWDGYLLETYFSAIVVRLVNGYVVVGKILS